MTLAEAAVTYARYGWAVLPLRPRGKLPLNAHGSREATGDEGLVSAWWEQTPNANVGIATGLASRLLAVDLDGDEGHEAWTRLAATHETPATLVSRTGSGGHHLLFTVARQVRNSAKLLGPGIDTRGEGGYIVAPPSIHPAGGVYQWEERRRPAAAPSWLLERIARRERQHASAAVIVTSEPTRYGTAALQHITDELAAAGHGLRNDTLNRAAWSTGRLAAAGHLPPSECRDKILAAADACGLPRWESERTFDSGFTAGLADPVDVPARAVSETPPWITPPRISVPRISAPRIAS